MSTQEAEPPKVAEPSRETKAPESSTETKVSEPSTETKGPEPLKKKDCKTSPRTWFEWAQGVKCEDGTGVDTSQTPITSVETTNPPTKMGGWFSRGGKRKSKAKKSRRKNRKQRKSRKSRK